MSEAIRLAVKFLTEVKGFEKDQSGKIKASDTYKKIVREGMEAVLAGGMTAGELDHALATYKATCPKASEAYGIDDVLKYLRITAKRGIVTNDPDNLLVRGRFYYHPQLQIAPPPPVVQILPDGTFRASYEEDPTFYLEMKEKYTLDDLLDYFYNRVGIKKQNRKRDRGALEYILKQYELDVVLYSIDESAVMYLDTNSSPPKNPLDIEDYVENGEALLEDRKNTLQMEGLDHVIPRS